MLLYWIAIASLLLVVAALRVSGVIRFDPTLHWSAWLVVALVLAVGTWMAFDGGRALVVGDYVTPKSGRFAGSLGPWAAVVDSIGIGPRSTFMKSVFLGYGTLYLAVTAAWLLGRARARLGILVIVLLILPPLRSPRAPLAPSHRSRSE
jgi:hypothetical protein